MRVRETCPCDRLLLVGGKAKLSMQKVKVSCKKAQFPLGSRVKYFFSWAMGKVHITQHILIIVPFPIASHIYTCPTFQPINLTGTFLRWAMGKVSIPIIILFQLGLNWVPKYIISAHKILDKCR